MPFFSDDFYKRIKSKLPGIERHWDGMDVGPWSLRLSNFNPLNPFKNLINLSNSLIHLVSSCGKPGIQLMVFSLMAVQAAAQGQVQFTGANGEKLVLDFPDSLIDRITNILPLLLTPNLLDTNSIVEGDDIHLILGQNLEMVRSYDFHPPLVFHTAFDDPVLLYTNDLNLVSQRFLNFLDHVLVKILDEKSDEELNAKYIVITACVSWLLFSSGLILFMHSLRRHEQRMNQLDLPEPQVAFPIRSLGEEKKNDVQIKFEQIVSDYEKLLSLAAKKVNQKPILNDLAEFKRNLDEFENGNTCGMSHDFLIDPVTLSSGMTFNHETIKTWLAACKAKVPPAPPTCPKLGIPLTETLESELHTNLSIKNSIEFGLKMLQIQLKSIEARHKLDVAEELSVSPLASFSRMRHCG